MAQTQPEYFAFQCWQGNINLCFNGGSCDDNVSACACPEPFEEDFEFFHFPNCARVKTSSEILFITFTVLGIFVVSLSFVYSIQKLKSKVRRIGILLNCSTISLWCVIVSLYAQQGCFEGCAVAIVVFFNLTATIIQQIVILALAPVYAVERRPITRLTRFLNAWTCLCVVAITTAGILMLYWTRAVDDRLIAYNKAAFVIQETLFIGGTVDVVALLKSSRKLKLKVKHSLATVETSQTQDNLKMLLRRLTFLEVMSTGFMLPLFALSLAIPLQVRYFGSVPYFFVYLYGLAMSHLLVFTSSIMLFLGYSRKDIKSQESSRNAQLISSVENKPLPSTKD